MIRLRAKGKTDPLESHKNHRSRKARQCWEFSRKKEFVLYDEFGLPKKVSVVVESMFTFLFLGFL